MRVQKLYEYILNRIVRLNKYFEYLEKKEYEKLVYFTDIAKKLDLEVNDELYLALITRVVSLREDNLKKYLLKSGFSETEIEKKLELAYEIVKEFWEVEFKKSLKFLKDNQLLNDFYRTLLSGIFEVGVEFNKWQVEWEKHIIKNINKELCKVFKNDEEVIKYLEENDLFDIGHNEIIADRCYSVLVLNEEGFEVKSYGEFFKKEVNEIVKKLESLQDRLIELEDDLFNHKWEWIEYIQTLIKAFSEIRREKLVHYWAEVDRAWMKIKTPLQIAHPLEYYEDKYRKAVALELDVRVSKESNNDRKEKIKKMFEDIYKSLEYKDEKIYQFSLNSLNKAQIYISLPLMFFGSELNGLFSAQVVPNDEVVSNEAGKKIFAYSDMILLTQRAKPFLKITKEFFPKEFIEAHRYFLFNEDQKWHKVYDITTIGHELGHILWCDEESEAVMNKSGNFKNIEEFKATTAGLVSFFLDKSENELEIEVINDLINRAVSLIAWMEVDEVKPYYSEGLIHLSLLKESKVVDFSQTPIKIDYSKVSFLKELYIKTYKDLAVTYLKKEDAKNFLFKFIKIKENKFLPKDEVLSKFTQKYYKRYLEIGNEIDFKDKGKYLKKNKG